MKNYKQIENELLEIGKAYGKTTRRFPGNNFITNQIVYTGRLPNGRIFELSYGTGIIKGWMFGLTISKEGQIEIDHDLSTSLFSTSEVRDALDNITNKEMAKSA